jgi:hypothetical protein
MRELASSVLVGKVNALAAVVGIPSLVMIERDFVAAYDVRLMQGNLCAKPAFGKVPTLRFAQEVDRQLPPGLLSACSV